MYVSSKPIELVGSMGRIASIDAQFAIRKCQ